MTEQPSPSDTGRDESDAPEATPRWVKAFAFVGVAFLLLVVFLLTTGGHGPGRHSLVPPAVAATQK